MMWPWWQAATAAATTAGGSTAGTDCMIAMRCESRRLDSSSTGIAVAIIKIPIQSTVHG